LETTNEELQSLNEELETTNQELEERTKELDQVNSVYAQTLEKIRLPVMLVNQDRRIEFWNQMALRMFGFKSKPPVDLTIDQLPLSESMRSMLIRRHRAVLVKEQPIVARGQDMGPCYGSTADVHFSVIPREDRTNNVLIMFEPQPGNGSAATRKGAKVRKR
jgi:two-component system CheB/CheR fusion protein